MNQQLFAQFSSHYFPSPSMGKRVDAAGRIRVFIVDDHPLARDGLSIMLSEHPDFEDVGAAADAEEALRIAPLMSPDVVVLDEDLPEASGVELVKKLRDSMPAARIVMMARDLPADLHRRAAAAGVSALLAKTASSSELAHAVKHAHQGTGAAATDQAHALYVNHSGNGSKQQRGAAYQLGDDLTKRERDLLNLLACGLSNQEISTRLNIAVPTVKFHVSNLMTKLGVENRTSAVLVALKNNLVAGS